LRAYVCVDVFEFGEKTMKKDCKKYLLNYCKQSTKFNPSQQQKHILAEQLSKMSEEFQ